jgi:hypothetical protein
MTIRRTGTWWSGIGTIILVALAFVVGGPLGLVVAALGWIARQRFGWRWVAWGAIAVLGLAAGASALHARPPNAFGNWVSSTLWVQELALSAVILLLIALQGAAASIAVSS